MTLTFRILPHGSIEYKLAVSLREEILRKPLGLAFDPEEIERENTHLHFAAFLDEELVATAAVASTGNTGKLQRVAVKVRQQRSGVGAQLMEFIESDLRARGCVALYCNARDSAVPFYEKIGYTVESEPFLEQGIAHLRMRRLLVNA